MKKNLILAAILSGAAAAHADPYFQYIGMAGGVNSYTNPQTKTDGAARANGTITFGEGRKVNDGLSAVAGEIQINSLNKHILPAAQVVYYAVLDHMNINYSPVLLALHSGVEARAGLTAGIDMVFTSQVLPDQCACALRVGFTVFQRKVDGANGIFSAGLFKSF